MASWEAEDMGRVGLAGREGAARRDACSPFGRCGHVTTPDVGGGMGETVVRRMVARRRRCGGEGRW